MLPAFRRQFAREVLRPGLTLRIARVSLLFTDLTDSTALYTKVGDAKAFGVVQAHFDLLSKIIAEQHGTIVKTIGDAVMAAFLHEQEAVRAAVAMHAAFPAFRNDYADAQGVRLKIGVYSGPCYAVTANSVLDYFGQSVNVAARLQGAAEAGELVMPEALAEEARAAGWLGPDPPVRHFEASLKGLGAPIRAERVLLDPA
jgi:class 3 adenylate cyclase